MFGFERIERWRKKRSTELAAMRNGRIAITASGFAVEKMGKRYELIWNDLQSIVAAAVPGLVGDELALFFVAEGPGSAVVSQSEANWDEVIDALKNNLSACLPYANWSLRLVGGEKAIKIYEKGNFPG